jgi:hypothetical protein
MCHLSTSGEAEVEEDASRSSERCAAIKTSVATSKWQE